MINDKTFMPAAPYTYKIYGSIDKEGVFDFCKVPIIAWYMRAEIFEKCELPNDHIYAFAVCHDDDGNAWEPQRNEAILYPCGTVVDASGGGTYHSVDEWQLANSRHFDK